jgi:hypothetical protein
MLIKLEVSIDQLEIIVDALETEYQSWEQNLGGDDEDSYDRLQYEMSKALMIKLDKQLIQLRLLEQKKEYDNDMCKFV